jgi:hypothetical protein
MGQALMDGITLGKAVVPGRFQKGFGRVADRDVFGLRARSTVFDGQHPDDEAEIQIVREVDQPLPKCREI